MLNLLLGTPLLFVALLFAGGWLLATALRALNIVEWFAKPYLYIGCLIALAAVLGQLAYAVVYLLSPTFTDHIEPNTAIVAWIYSSGGQIYHSLDAAERYAFLYGPGAYMATGLMYKLLGPGMLAAKLAGFVFFLLTLVTLTLTGRRSFPGRWYPTLALLGYFSLFALLFKNHSFWSKPDPFMIAAVAVGLYACTMKTTRGAAVLCGLALGIEVNAKVTGALYFLPLVAYIARRDGIRALAEIVAASVFLALLPFVDPGRVSLVHYLAWLRSAGNHGISTELLIRNGLFLLLALLPVLGVLLMQRRVEGRFRWLLDYKLVTFATFLSVVLIWVAASKPGSGPHHFLPFLPLFAFATAAGISEAAEKRPNARVLSSVWVPVLAVLIVVAMKAGLALYYGFSIVNAQAADRQLVNELAELDKQYPARNIYMGYGDGTRYPLTFVRPVLVYARNPYLVDASAMMDFQYSGLPLPQATIDALLDDSKAVWLIPRDQEPFALPNWYYRDQPDKVPLFDDAFRKAFAEGFSKDASTEHYDVYVRKAG